MPCEHRLTPFEESVLATCETSKKAVGFDGLFSLPDEQRVLLEAKSIGARAELMRVISHLQLGEDAARALFLGLMSQPEPQSVQEVEKFFHDLQRPSLLGDAGARDNCLFHSIAGGLKRN